MLLDKFLASRRWKVDISPGDGHCLLHSIISSMRGQFPNAPQLMLSVLKNHISNHTIGCALEYLMFGFSEHTLLKQMCQCADDKNYSSDFGNIIPLILAKLLNKNICIWHTDRHGIITEHMLDASPQDNATLYLQREGEHYNGIVSPPARNQLPSELPAPTAQLVTETPHPSTPPQIITPPVQTHYTPLINDVVNHQAHTVSSPLDSTDLNPLLPTVNLPATYHFPISFFSQIRSTTGFC